MTVGITRAVLAKFADIGAASEALAVIDVSSALADLARGEVWSRPIVDDSRALDITAGRHPVVETALAREGGTGFVANDCA